MKSDQDIKVSKTEKKVEVLFKTNQSETEECTLFLNQYSRFEKGEETLKEFLNNCERFIPVKTSNSNTCTIVNLNEVIYMLEKERTRLFAKKKVLLFLTDDIEIEVGHFNNLPDYHSRILDYLNKDEPFAPFLFKGVKIYINKEKIIRSKENDEY